MTDGILMTGKIAKDTDGSWLTRCPHCERVIGLADGPIRGEQFRHRYLCGGWLEVSRDAVKVDTAEL